MIDLGADEVRSFLSHLAVNDRIGASTQNQALSALLFLYRHSLGKEVGLLEGVERAKGPKRLPVALARAEVKAVLGHMRGVPQLVCRLLYGAGLRLSECLTLRVKDVDFERRELTIRDGKGAKDRVSVLPASCQQALLEHLERVRRLHEEGLGRGLGRAPLPFALARKYAHADREWGWQYVFPASSHYTDRHTGLRHRHHLHETVVQRAMGEAVRRAQLAKPATPHTLPALIRLSPAGERLRHPDHPGVDGPQRDHDDLHPCPEPRRPGRAEPRGRAVTAAVGNSSRRYADLRNIALCLGRPPVTIVQARERQGVPA